MTKFTIDAALDGLADYIRANITQAIVVSGDPANFAAISGTELATVAYGPSDVVSANGDSSGRKHTYAAKTGVTVTQSGTANHICYCSNSVLLQKTQLQTPLALTASGQIDIPAVDSEVADPT